MGKSREQLEAPQRGWVGRELGIHLGAHRCGRLALCADNGRHVVDGRGLALPGWVAVAGLIDTPLDLRWVGFGARVAGPGIAACEARHQAVTVIQLEIAVRVRRVGAIGPANANGEFVLSARDVGRGVEHLTSRVGVE